MVLIGLGSRPNGSHGRGRYPMDLSLAVLIPPVIEEARMLQTTRQSSRRISAHLVMLAFLGTMLMANSGCIRFAANLLYAIRGNDAPAEYDGLKEKRVAIICTTTGAVASEAVNSMLTSNISSALSRNLKKSDIVREDEINRWIEMDGWSDADPIRLAKGVKADQLVTVSIDNLKLRDGATLFRGQCDIHVKVYDIKNGGKQVFDKLETEHSFPRNGGTPITETTEARFRSAYLQLVGYRVSSLFHPIDPTYDVALDATASKLQ